MGRPVGGAPVDALGAAAEAQGGLDHGHRAGSAGCDAALDAGRHLRLAGANVGQELLEVGDPAGRPEPLGEGPGGLTALGLGQVEVDEVGVMRSAMDVSSVP